MVDRVLGLQVSCGRMGFMAVEVLGSAVVTVGVWFP